MPPHVRFLYFSFRHVGLEHIIIPRVKLKRNHLGILRFTFPPPVMRRFLWKRHRGLTFVWVCACACVSFDARYKYCMLYLAIFLILIKDFLDFYQILKVLKVWCKGFMLCRVLLLFFSVWWFVTNSIYRQPSRRDALSLIAHIVIVLRCWMLGRSTCISRSTVWRTSGTVGRAGSTLPGKLDATICVYWLSCAYPFSPKLTP